MRTKLDLDDALPTHHGKGGLAVGLSGRSNKALLDAADKGQITAAVDAAQEAAALKDMFGPAKKTVSINEMNAAIARKGASAR